MAEWRSPTRKAALLFQKAALLAKKAASLFIQWRSLARKAALLTQKAALLFIQWMSLPQKAALLFTGWRSVAWQAMQVGTPEVMIRKNLIVSIDGPGFLYSKGK